MRECGFHILGCLLFVATAFGQETNTLHVTQHPGLTVGRKLTAAQNACDRDATVPCTLVLDTILSAHPQGSFPAKCSQCIWQYLRTGTGQVKASQTAPETSAGNVPAMNGMLNAALYSGSDIGAGIGAAGASCSWSCTVYVPAGNYAATTTVLIPLNPSSTFRLQCSDGANITYTGSGYFIDTYEPGIQSGSNGLKIEGCKITGTSSAVGAIRILPSQGVVIRENLITGFSSGDGVTLVGANTVTLRNNTITYNLNGLRFYSTKCLTTSPYTCSPAQSGSTNGYAVNALDVQTNVISSNVHWGVFDDQTQGFQTQQLNNSFSRNVLEGNGTGGRSYGGMLLSYSIGAVIDKSYFEGQPRNIVVGTRCCNNQNTVISGNYFTIGSQAPNTIELLTAIGSIVRDNVEFGSGSTCFVNQTTVLNTFFGPNTTGSTNVYCQGGSPGNSQTDTVVTSGALKVNAISLLPSLSATTRSIGGSSLAAGACASGTVGVSNSTTSMAVDVSPNTYPGDGYYWRGYVNANGTVTVKVCAVLAGTPRASTYNVRVIQ